MTGTSIAPTASLRTHSHDDTSSADTFAARFAASKRSRRASMAAMTQAMPAHHATSPPLGSGGLHTVRDLPETHYLAAQHADLRALPQASTSKTPYGPSTPDVRSRWSTRPDTSSTASADFDVDVRSGFLPPQEPIQRLLGELEDWELALDAREGMRYGGAAFSIEAAEAWRTGIRSMPVLSVTNLSTLPLLRRAHVVLSFLGHAYIHSTFPSGNVVPASIAVPWVEVSERLDMPPILTYADTVLWNWRFKDPSRGWQADNFEISQTFTGSKDEEHFFLTSLLCELRGVPALRLMSHCLDEAWLGDAVAKTRITRNLDDLVTIVESISQTIIDVRTDCAPHAFYFEIRPWFVGGLWTYEGVQSHLGLREVREYGGPSAGQSSLIHSLDVFLGVDHSARPEPVIQRLNAASRPPPADKESTFMHRMAFYMPQHHRQFLSHLQSHPRSVRELALADMIDPASADLRKSYDRVVQSLKGLRSAHMNIVTLYIITQSRALPPPGSKLLPPPVVAKAEQELKGTGGTELVRFLKMCRDRTVEALLIKQ
ncbi:uncharacterized protein L969DRAFT_21923 [Mixia osmundae IAM 14324]|uniref:Indoleamine 2,3-dioxygenase n=1 Tax=Mixia osmundae (strain CBS 9802 / IAM 14324 / JCM 22182 / KY 12970) TaxID=764103 RepID=G7DXD8_MIXOS|nr:uncharacterized protein L969DRAFT_21923 [Mixia osmundae IAM 14324]KEI41258.1 hypothetical protein L969DRAFT_21923 [Mixia osmundae IAM 14324]GAA95248.1 hypothetical protein E5Q_01904 [Mixia osmundae IAM 14324]